MGRMIAAGPDARPTGTVGVSLPEAVELLPRRLTERAAARSLAPNSATGISLALSLGAAIWFSAGTRADSIKGALVLGASYLAWRVARGLVDSAAERGAWSGLAGADLMAEICGALSEFAIYAGLAVAGYAAHWGNTWIIAIAVVIAMAVRKTITACRGAGLGLLPAGGIAARPGAPHDAKAWGAGYLLGRALWSLMTVSPGWRFLVIAVAVPTWGAHTALLVLLDWEIIAAGFAIAGPGPRYAATPSPASAAEPGAGARPGGSARLPGLEVPLGLEARPGLEVRPGLEARPGLDVPPDLSAPPELVAPPAWAGSPALAAAVGPAGTAEMPRTLAGAAEPGMAEPPPLEAALTEPPATERVPAEPLVAEPVLAEPFVAEPVPAEPTMTLDQMIHHDRLPEPDPEPESAVDPRAPAIILACRDDGAAAVWLGQLVRGQFVPLPPAIAGLAATCLLAVLGLRNLPGILLLTPLVVMLLAAPGNSHPHDGRLDWMVPAVLLAGQLVYVAALGFSFRIPAAVTFTLCAAVALRYLDLTTRDPNEGQIPDTRLGWEGRMLAVGLGAMFGIGMIAFLAMTAYLGVLICGNVTASCLAGRGNT